MWSQCVCERDPPDGSHRGDANVARDLALCIFPAVITEQVALGALIPLVVSSAHAGGTLQAVVALEPFRLGFRERTNALQGRSSVSHRTGEEGNRRRGEERETNSPQAIEGAAAGGPQSSLSLRLMMAKTIHETVHSSSLEGAAKKQKTLRTERSCESGSGELRAARVVAMNLQSTGVGRLDTQRQKHVRRRINISSTTCQNIVRYFFF